MIGERIHLARRARGLNQRQLGAMTGMSAAAISKIERGASLPTSEHLDAIARITRFDAAFFSRPVSPLPTPMYRKNAALGKKRMDTIEALAEVYSEAFANACHGAAVSLPVRIPECARSDIEEAAMKTRRALRLPDSGPCLHVLAPLEQAGCIIHQLQWILDKFDGFSTWWEGRPVIVLDRGTEGIGDRCRLTAAHELGHLVLHRHGGVDEKDAELEANWFGGAYLMPRDAIARDLKSVSLTPVGLAPLKAKWRVSIAALLMRAHRLGLVSDYAKERAFREMSARRWRKREPVDIPLERPEVLRKVLNLLREHRSMVEIGRVCGGLDKSEVARLLGFDVTTTSGGAERTSAS